MWKQCTGMVANKFHEHRMPVARTYQWLTLYLICTELHARLEPPCHLEPPGLPRRPRLPPEPHVPAAWHGRRRLVRWQILNYSPYRVCNLACQQMRLRCTHSGAVSGRSLGFDRMLGDGEGRGKTSVLAVSAGCRVSAFQGHPPRSWFCSVE